MAAERTHSNLQVLALKAVEHAETETGMRGGRKSFENARRRILRRGHTKLCVIGSEFSATLRQLGLGKSPSKTVRMARLNRHGGRRFVLCGITGTGWSVTDSQRLVSMARGRNRISTFDATEEMHAS